MLNILGNVTLDRNGNFEVLQSGYLSKLDGILINNYFLHNFDFLDAASWAINCTSQNFNANFANQISNQELLKFLVRVLNLPETDKNSMRMIDQCLDSIHNFLKCQDD